MATIAQLGGIVIDGVGAAQEWRATPSLGGPTPAAGNPSIVTWTSPLITLADGAGDYHAFISPIGGTLKGCFVRIITDGVGAVADVDVFVDIDGTNATGSKVTCLVADMDVEKWIPNDAIITAANVIAQGDVVLIELVETTAFTAGTIEVVLLIQPD